MYRERKFHLRSNFFPIGRDRANQTYLYRVEAKIIKCLSIITMGRIQVAINKSNNVVFVNSYASYQRRNNLKMKKTK